MKKLQHLIQLEQQANKQQSSTKEEFLNKEATTQEEYRAKFAELEKMLSNKDDIISKEVEKRIKKLSGKTQYEGKSLHKDAKARLLAELNK